MLFLRTANLDKSNEDKLQSFIYNMYILWYKYIQIKLFSLSKDSSVRNPPHMYTFSLLYRAQKSNTIRASGY